MTGITLEKNTFRVKEDLPAEVSKTRKDLETRKAEKGHKIIDRLSVRHICLIIIAHRK